jgi:hypothetical protein
VVLVAKQSKVAWSSKSPILRLEQVYLQKLLVAACRPIEEVLQVPSPDETVQTLTNHLLASGNLNEETTIVICLVIGEDKVVITLLRMLLHLLFLLSYRVRLHLLFLDTQDFLFRWVPMVCRCFRLGFPFQDRLLVRLGCSSHLLQESIKPGIVLSE